VTPPRNQASPFNALFVSTSYPADASDWRGRFIANIVSALSRRKDVHLTLWAPPGSRPTEVLDAADPEESVWLRGLLDAGGIAQILRTDGIWAVVKVLRLLLYLRRTFRRQPTSDLMHINWIQNALPLWGMPQPAVISVLGSDYGLLTYPGLCPMLRSVFRQRNCILAPNAGWMAPRLNQLFQDTAEIRPIPYGVDATWFNISRQTPPEGVFRWLVVSRVTSKKIGYLFDWGRDLFRPPNELHLIGPMQEKVQLPPWVHYHGPASPEDLMHKWFPTAAGLITLSRHDEGRPQVILEAMAAGLPVIASDLPAHRDVICHRSTGWLVATPTELAQALSALSNGSINQEVGKTAREWVAREVGTWDDCAGRYVQAYRDVVEARS
jgi:glycosyltransferase involved in cell wall biosynthesis